MPTWLSDPIVRAALRHSVGWMRCGPVVPVLFIELERGGNTRLARLTLFALCYAAPQAASYLLQLEHDGRLDQIRLSGRRPIDVVAVALASVAGPWLAVGLVLTILTLLRAEAPLLTAAAIAAVAGVPTAVAAFSTTVRFARERIDPRIGMAALTFIAIATALAGGDVFNVLSGTLPIFAIALVVETAIVVACVRHLPRRIAHPPVLDGARVGRFRLPASEWILRWPGIYRGALLGSSGLVLFALFAPIGVVVRILSDRNPQSIATPALYLPPLFIGLIAVSLICREDAMSGRLDLIRQSPKAVAVAALAMLIGLWSPFVVAAAGLAVLAHLLFGVERSELAWAMLFAILLAPVPLFEGWSRQWPFMSTAPFGIALGFLTGLEAWPALLAMSAGIWIGAARVLSHPDKPALSGWQGLIAIVTLSTSALLTVKSSFEAQLIAMAMAAMFLAVSPVLIVPDAHDWTQRWGQFLVILLSVFGAGSARMPMEDASYLSVMALAVWFCAYRIRQLNPSRPTIQGAVRLALLVGIGLGVESLSTSTPRIHSEYAIWAIALAATVELLHHTAAWITRQRRRPILPA